VMAAATLVIFRETCMPRIHRMKAKTLRASFELISGIL